MSRASSRISAPPLEPNPATEMRDRFRAINAPILGGDFADWCRAHRVDVGGLLQITCSAGKLGVGSTVSFRVTSIGDRKILAIRTDADYGETCLASESGPLHAITKGEPGGGKEQKKEYRVAWKRNGLSRKSKRFARQATAEKLAALICAKTAEKVLSLRGLDPDEEHCCSGFQCGLRWRDQPGKRAGLPGGDAVARILQDRRTDGRGLAGGGALSADGVIDSTEPAERVNARPTLTVRARRCSMALSSLPDYHAFLDSKSQLDSGSGFEPRHLPAFLFDFQRYLVEYNLRQGRSATFADCGLGKSPMQLVWAENVIRKTGRPVLGITPIAVSAQLISEANKFGIDAERSWDGSPRKCITVTNIERLHLFNPADFAGAFLDESGILKNEDGVYCGILTEFMRRLEYRLLCTALAAPNRYPELGTHSEALGYLGYADMLNRFFKNDQNSSHPNRRWAGGDKWRFRGHAREPFWRWVCSWSRSLRKPSDLGFSDEQFKLPPLIETEHLVEARTLPPGMLFPVTPKGLAEEREEQGRTIEERCERAAELVNDTCEPFIMWCHRNKEGDVLSRLVRDGVQVSGQDSDDEKERKFLAFSSGQARGLIIKPKIGAWGMNWQHCAHMTVFPSHSFEQYYQEVRRCWRFGQDKPVKVDVVATNSGLAVLKNLQRKAAQADVMFTELVSHMNDALRISRSVDYTLPVEVPSWLA